MKVAIGLFIAGMAWGQAAEKRPSFEIADVHESAKGPNQYLRTGPVRGGRYELKQATMIDLIRQAYGFDPDKILGGPSWLEMNRYDVTAKVPPGTTPESQKEMLQSLLEDRFALVTHKENKPMPTYALMPGKKLLMKESDGSGGQTGCHPQESSGPSPAGGAMIMISRTVVGGGGTSSEPMRISLGPGMTITYQCRNMTMSEFASGLRGMFGASLNSTNPVTDETGLKGMWNFDLKYSMGLVGLPNTNDERISLQDAVEKQLGLKLDRRDVPTPVLVVDSAKAEPTANSPELAKLLPPVDMPKEFEVASVKESDPASQSGRFQMPVGGRIVMDNMPLKYLIQRAFNSNNEEQVQGIPKFAETARFDITAKAALGPDAPAALDMDTVGPPLRALLAERFKMTYHTEDRQVSAYSLVSAKPKMKKADPNSRSNCKNVGAPAGSPPGTRVFTCQNVTMAQFAERLQGMSPELVWPVSDATGIEGGWDLTLTYIYSPQMAFSMAGMAVPARTMAVAGTVGAAGGSDVVSASDPTGGLPFLQALEKQLGLKLELQKKAMPVVVIDHLEQKPTEN